MSYFKRFLLLGSVSVALLAGLLGTFHSQVSSTAFASGCNTVAKGEWKYNCIVSDTEYSNSNFVYAIQEDINGYSYRGGPCGPTLAVDGSFGPATEKAVKCFQYQNNLTQDGDVGQFTWQDLQAFLYYQGKNGGWADYTAYPGTTNITDFREYVGTGTTGIWYVYATPPGKAGRWCQINDSAPC